MFYKKMLIPEAANMVLHSTKEFVEIPAAANRGDCIHLKADVNHLKRKLLFLNKSVDHCNVWRQQIAQEIDRIKSETLEQCSRQLESVGQKIDDALTLYDADKVGMIDYALESSGGFVTSTPYTQPVPSRLNYNLMGWFSISGEASNPRLLIQAGTLPGQCFAFRGSYGRIRIRLVSKITITAVTLEHAYPKLVEDMSSAPRNFQVYGLLQEDSEGGDSLGVFAYSLADKPLQTFYIRRFLHRRYEHIELRILTNHGSLDYTCIYRFRVHGKK